MAMPSKPMSSPATPPSVPVTSRFRFSWNIDVEFYRRRGDKSTCLQRLHRNLRAAQEGILVVDAAGHVGVLRRDAAGLDLRGQKAPRRTGRGRTRQAERADLH